MDKEVRGDTCYTLPIESLNQWNMTLPISPLARSGWCVLEVATPATHQLEHTFPSDHSRHQALCQLLWTKCSQQYQEKSIAWSEKWLWNCIFSTLHKLDHLLEGLPRYHQWIREQSHLHCLAQCITVCLS